MSDTPQMLELSADTLQAQIDSLKQNWDKVRKGMAKPKVDTSKARESMTKDQRKSFDAMFKLLTDLDNLIHHNFDSVVGQVIYQELRKITSDALARTNYLVDIDVREAKLELSSELTELVSQCKKQKEQIEFLHGYLQASGVKLPDSIYKHEDGKLYKTKAGNTVLDLPRIFDIDDSGEASKRGRPATTKTIVLGVCNPDNPGVVIDTPLVPIVLPEIDWHENDNVSTTFMELYGSIRSDHNFAGLVKAVEATDQSVTKGWNVPVEYAGKHFVARVKTAA